MMFSYYSWLLGRTNSSGNAVLPSDIDKLLDATNGYSGDCLIWDKLIKFFDKVNISLTYNRFFGSYRELHSKLKESLEKGMPVLGRVDYGSDSDKNYNHFILLHSIIGDDIGFHDPATSQGDFNKTFRGNTINTCTRKKGYELVQLDLYIPSNIDKLKEILDKKS